jgi:hypothetical protein
MKHKSQKNKMAGTGLWFYGNGTLQCLGEQDDDDNEFIIITGRITLQLIIHFGTQQLTVQKTMDVAFM